MRLRAATLNVWALPEPLGHLVLPRMRAIGAALPGLDLDVVTFQEVWTQEARDVLVDAARHAGLEHVWHRESALAGSGLLLLSRRPFLDVQFERFALPGLPPRPDHPDYYGGKGFARIRLATEAGPLSLVGTHLQARYSSDVDHEYRGYRVGQIVQLAFRLQEIHDPLVVAGDFNVAEGTQEYQVLTGLTGLRDAAAELGQRDPTVYYSHPFRHSRRKPDRRVDFVFLRHGAQRGVRVRSIERVFDDVFELSGRPASFSNHAGLLAELEVGEYAPAPAAPFDPRAVELAQGILARGRARAELRRHGTRLAAGVGLGAAALAACGSRTPALSRRRLLRGMLQGAGLLALTPSVGFSVLAEYFAPDELRAYEELSHGLGRVAAGEGPRPELA